MNKVVLIFVTVIAITNAEAQTPYATPDNISSGNCLDFDGISDHINCGESTSLNTILSGDFTIEGWAMYTGGAGQNKGLVSRGDLNSFEQDKMILVGINGATEKLVGIVRGNNGGGATSTILGNTILPGNEWFHFAFVVDRGVQAKLYLNGKEDASPIAENAGAISFTAARPLGIGVQNLGAVGAGGGTPVNAFFPGKIDEVRIWNITRTQAEIQDNMCRTLSGNETGLIGYWNMNEGTGNTVSDLTSNNNDGTRQ